ncbi:MAG: M23 family metallopeptidase [Candidatus Electrothrix sp. AR4]|nr:M23 family metallopeptidase [Candidatus Electrothrix sp. AR4]
MTRKNRRRIGTSSRASSRKGLGRKVLYVFILLIVVSGAAAGFILFEAEKPQVILDKKLLFLGGPMDVQLSSTDKRSGIQQISIVLQQDGKEYQLFSKRFPRLAWLSQAGPAEVKETITLDAQHINAKEGAAELTVTVHDFSLNGGLKGNTTTLAFSLTIDTQPPRVLIEHTQLYMTQGGSGIAVYSVSEPMERHGVMLDDTFFPGYPVKGDEKRFIAYIALPWDKEKPKKTRVVAVDQAGNEGNAIFSMRYKKARDKKDRINVSDGFLKKKIPEFQESYPELEGTDVEKYLFVNNTVRIRNAKKIAEISRNTASEQLWRDRFIRMPGAGKAGYADQRTYYYQGEPVDHQTHLGIDIASTARVAVEAANRGRVIFSDYLGIYGNTVILDHGQGLTSLYSHLSHIDAEIGNLVEKGEQIGNSGTTGMAGGDHLHYSMLIHGIFVTPVEWWDQHWIDVNITHVIQ